MKIAFTIVLNGLHHLQHQDFYQKMVKNFDLWVLAEGATKNNGSTSWCHPMPDSYHSNGRSIDGTLEFIQKLEQQHPHVKVVTSQGLWESKDQQVNAAITKIKSITNKGILFQVDVDEIWSASAIRSAAKELQARKLKTGACLANCYLSENLQVTGQWGECAPVGYYRVWDWTGEYFSSHEPPTLQGGNGNLGTLNARFDHYNYYFTKDVQFKNDWYNGHQDILTRWHHIRTLKKEHFPMHISNLIVGKYGLTDSAIIWRPVKKYRLFF